MEVTNVLLTMDDLPGQSVDPLYRQYGTLHAGTSIHLQNVISSTRTHQYCMQTKFRSPYILYGGGLKSSKKRPSNAIYFCKRAPHDTNRLPIDSLSQNAKIEQKQP